MKVQVLPVILEQEKAAVEKKLKRAREWVERVQIDVIDGKFVDNTTVSMEELMEINKQMGWDIHLMVEEPARLVGQCAEAEVELVVGQIELMESQLEFVRLAKEKQLKVGLGLDLETGVDFLDEEVIMELDQILLMAVKAGFSGQKFDKRVLEKIRQVRQLGFEKEISVDGGVNRETVEECVKAGARALAVNSGLWQAEKTDLELKRLRRLAEAAVKS
jgi:ribulose-phosphate 3-epimerase